MAVERFFGKYRGQVTGNIDPLMLGRVQVRVPAVLGDGSLSWAMPCVPYAGKGVGVFMIPPVGANVWVEFEGGNPDYPIWAGCFWGLGEVPATPAVAEIKIIKTDYVGLTLSDLPGGGGVTLEVSPPVVATPVKITINTGGIEVSQGAANIKIDQVSVNVNNGALEVI